MRPFSIRPDLPQLMVSPISRAAVRRGRITAGALAALGAFALLHAGEGVAEAKTQTSNKGSSAKPAVVAKKTVVVPAPAPAPVTYTIKNGDSLWTIAARNKVTVKAIVEANRIANPDKISAGKSIVLPKTTAPVAAPTAPPPMPPAKVAAKAVDVFSEPAPKASPGGPMPSELASSNRKHHHATFVKAALDYGLPVDLLEAMAWNESGWNNKMRSSAGAMGIGQLMPDTVAFVNESLIGKPLDPHRPEHNIRMSAAFLRYLLDETKGDTRMALAAYYQGLASVRRIGPFADTKAYVKTVLAVQRAYF